MADKNPDYGTNLLLPDATSGWSHMKEPDTGGKKKNGSTFKKAPTWDIEILVEDTPEWNKILQELTAFENARCTAYGLPTVDITTAVKTDKDGNRILKPYSKDQTRYVLVNPDRSPYTDNVFKGSKVSVSVVPCFSTLRNNLVLYLNGVMVLEKPAYEPDQPSGGGAFRDPFAARMPAPAATAKAETPPFDTQPPAGKMTDPFAGVR